MRSETNRNRCIRCGAYLGEGREICPMHLDSNGEQWHINNKIMCDLFHRGIEPPRVIEDLMTWKFDHTFGVGQRACE